MVKPASRRQFLYFINYEDQIYYLNIWRPVQVQAPSFPSSPRADRFLPVMPTFVQPTMMTMHNIS